VTDRRLTQLRTEAAHWQLAVDALADLDTIAAPAAWEALERYLHHRVRGRLAELARAVQTKADDVARMFDAGRSADEIRLALLQLRTHYLRAETLLDFFGDAVNSRTNPRLAELLRGYDIIASESMASTLQPLGIASPPALVYHDKGLGASILRAGIRLWDESHPSPVAAIKLTRHGLYGLPTSMLHECGHQVLALCGYNDELQQRLYEALAPLSSRMASLVSSWSSELGADVHAVHHAGWAPAFALSNVVDGTSAHVFRIRVGDPHPPPLVRTLFNVGLVRAWYGAGPWDDLTAVWTERHPLSAAGSNADITRNVLEALGTVIEIASMTPMRSFRGKTFGDLVDPRRASPSSLRALEEQAGGTLLTSTYLQRREPVRILALLATRGLLEPDRSHEHRTALVDWVRSVGRESRVPAEVAA